MINSNSSFSFTCTEIQNKEVIKTLKENTIKFINSRDLTKIKELETKVSNSVHYYFESRDNIFSIFIPNNVEDLAFANQFFLHQKELLISKGFQQL